MSGTVRLSFEERDDGGTVAQAVNIGGLAGSNHSSIAGSSFSGTVSAHGEVGRLIESNTGGLVGVNSDSIYSSISGSSASGTVSGVDNVGGLVGVNIGSIRDSSAVGTVSGNHGVGGLVGQAIGSIRDSSAAGRVSGVGDVGGLVGINRGTISNSSAGGPVTGSNDVGGLVGRNRGTIKDSSSSSEVSGDDNVGGLVGQNTGGISDSDASGTVTGIRRVGGLVGYAYIPSLLSFFELRLDRHISDSSAVGAVFGGESVGGLVGLNDLTIRNSAASGAVSGDESVGGLVGLNDNFGEIAGGEAEGDVTGKTFVGGLIGKNQGTVAASTASGNVAGGVHIGSLVGINDGGTITDSEGIGTTTFLHVPGDHDADNDGLIEISNLDQLNAIRYDLDGDGSSDDGAYSAAFPDAFTGMGCPTACVGYELMADLDFDTNGNGRPDAGDAYWNDGAGWTPIGDLVRGSFGGTVSRFNAIFEGNGFTISSLYIGVADSGVPSGSGRYGGLFGITGADSLLQQVRLVSVNVSSGSRVGGLVGGNGGTVVASYATGNVSSDLHAGGLVGWNGGTVVASYATGNVSGDDVDKYIGNAGGLVGWNDGTVTGGGAAGSVSGRSNVGGLVGWNRGTVTASYATGSVSGGGGVGGLVGENDGAVTASYATGSVSGGYHVGGLVGGNDGAVTASYATGSVSGGENVGGLVGNNYGAVTASYATGSVSGGYHVGGLVGGNDGAVTASYATGSVSGGENVGGLVGNNYGAVTASYATGSVSGSRDVGGRVSGSDDVGGLVGRNAGAVTASYATGNVSGSRDVGGLVGGGANNFAVADSYWDIQTSGQTESSGGEGKTTAELQSPTGYVGIYAGWNVDLNNFDLDGDLATGGDDPWDFGTSSEYPVLRNVGLPSPVAPGPTVLLTAPRLYWVDETTQKIQGITGEGHAQTVADLATAAQGLKMPGSIALDPLASKMYWTDDGAEGESDGRIQRANLDGSSVENLFSGLADPVGIALDLRAGRLYWADRALGGIYRGNLADISDAGLLTSYESLVANLEKPYQIALDTVNGHMYWTERGENNKHIRRADLDGGNVTDIDFELEPFNPFGLALDPVAGRMYWTERDGGGDVIASADLNGRNGEVLIESAPHSLSGIAVDVNDGRIYWTDEQTGTIRRADPEDPNPTTEVVVSDLSAPEGIAIARPYLSSTRLGLTALYRSTDGPNWTNNYNWLSAAHPGTWHGVTTDETEGVVIGLNLINNGLAGEMPPELGYLNRLEWLNLSGNRLTGKIPDELDNLDALKILVLSGNQLNGSIPAGLGNRHLTSLKLSRNQLSGTLPTEFGNLVSLRRLDLSGNRLSGPIPGEFGRLAKLKELDLSENQLTGSIPYTLSSIGDLAGCGTIGQTALTQQALEAFRQYSGSLADLEILDLSDNGLSGEIPAMLCSLADLQELDLGYNRLKGAIPPELGKMAQLRVLRLEGQSPYNKYLFSGQEDEERLANCPDECYLHGEIPSQLGRLTKLIELDLSHNRLSGSIPGELGGLLTIRSPLQRLDLSHNRLSGSIPVELGRLKALSDLNLSHNALGEDIPYILGDSVSLATLDLSNNQLGGEIPAQVVNLPVLKRLSLHGNVGFTGCVDITTEMASRIRLVVDAHGVPPTCEVLHARLHEKRREYVALQNMYLATNGDGWTKGNQGSTKWHVDRDVYDEAITLDSFSEETFDYGNWHGVVVGEVDGEDRIIGLRLNDNNLRGSIPPGLHEDLPHLEYLTLGGNPLEGCIPTGLSPALAVGEGFRDPDFTLANHEPGMLTAVTTATAQAALTEVGAQKITKDLLEAYPSLDLDTAEDWANDYLETGIELTNAVVWVFQSSAVKLNVPVCAPPAPEPPIPGAGQTQTGDTDQAILLEVKEKFVSQCVETLGKTEAQCINENKFGSWREDNRWSHSNWLFDSGWHGVQIKGGRVTRLSLDDRNLQGPIPPELGGLGELKYLNLSGNRLTGPIPPEFGNLVNLETLGLNNNKLANVDEEGQKTRPPIPPELGNLTRLQEFNVQVNELEGWLPLELSMLTRHSLTQMDLDREGEIEGCLPAYSWATTEALLALSDLGIDVAVTVGAAIAAGPTFGTTAPGAVAGAVKVANTARTTFNAIKMARLTQIGAWAARTAPRSAKYVKHGTAVVQRWETAHPVVFGVTVAGGKEFAKGVSAPMVESTLEAYGGPVGRAFLTDISLTEFLSDVSGKGAIIMGKVWCGDP